MKRRTFARILWLIGLSATISDSPARPPVSLTNVWTKTQDGHWDEVAAWSAGQLPARTHIIVITNSTPKTIEIDSQTAQNFPGSLSISSLVMSNSNTLFLNHVGATFQVDFGTNIYPGLKVANDAKLLSIESDLSVHSWLQVVGGELLQDGGSIQVTPSTTVHSGGNFRLTNGVFQTGFLESVGGGKFHQYGGTAIVTNNLWIRDFGNYYLHGGELSVPTPKEDFKFMVADWSSFTQEGGTLHSTSLGVFGAAGPAAYLLDGGECNVGSLKVGAGIATSSFEQNGGLLVVSNNFEIGGSARYYPPQAILGSYILGSNAVLRAGSLTFNQSWGFCAFESSGQATISGDVQFQFLDSPDYPGDFLIYDGTFSCQNFRDDGAVVDISQTGGALNVAGAFSFTGYYPGIYNGLHARPARYDFKAGTLAANRIDLAAEWVIGSSSQTHRINNPGQISLAGILRVGDANEILGRFILSNSATINLGDGNAHLAFAASGGESWNDSATLFIVNWEGSLSGGGSDQLKFGTDGAGLSARQIQQILFVNPAGLQVGQYNAKILNSGEIVPAVVPQLSLATAANGLQINWSDNRVLQSAPNVNGPYADVPSASSPYTLDPASSAQLFLRLRP